MRRGLVWLVVFLSWSVSSSACALGKKRPPQPEREVCFIGDQDCICYDPRFNEPPAGMLPIACDREGEETQGRDTCYIRPIVACRNYQAYSPADYDALQEWLSRNCYGPRDEL